MRRRGKRRSALPQAAFCLTETVGNWCKERSSQVEELAVSVKRETLSIKQNSWVLALTLSLETVGRSHEGSMRCFQQCPIGYSTETQRASLQQQGLAKAVQLAGVRLCGSPSSSILGKLRSRQTGFSCWWMWWKTLFQSHVFTESPIKLIN